MRRITRISSTLLKNRRGAMKETKSLFNTTLRTTSSLQLEWEPPKETIFHNLVNQQKRGYAPNTNAGTNDCWNCKKQVAGKMMCPECGHLQDVDMDTNYFELMDFQQTFALEVATLTKRFRQLQTLVHPDKFSNKSSREQSNSADWSSLINKAYKTLLVPIERAQYLLKLNGRQIPQDNSALDKEFLMEMMERNEEVADANTKSELDEIHGRLSLELQQKVADLNKTFDENDLNAATSVMVEMKYLLSIQKTIKNKLQSLMGS